MMTLQAEPTVLAEESPLTDLELVQAAQAGERRAFGELVRRHRAGTVGVVYRMCGDAQLAEEAAQDAFLRAWQNLAGYRPEHSFRAWVYRIAVNAALDALRRDQAHPTHSLDGLDGQPGEDGFNAAPAPGDDPEAALVRKQRAERVRLAVMALPAPSRAVLVLREYGALSYAEIAGALDIPLGTVMSRLSSARGQLRQSLAAFLEVL